MIKSALTTGLAQKIATAIEKRIAFADEDHEVQEDMRRIERLHKYGQLSLRQYESSLRAAIGNSALSQEFRDTLQERLKELTEVIGIPLKPVEGGNLQPYDTSTVIVPRSAAQSDGNASWNVLESAAARSFLQQISPIDGAILTSPESTVCQIFPLPWLDKVDIVRVFDPLWAIEDLVIYYLVHEGSLFRLNGTSPPIHEVNQKASINLTEDNVLDYLRFFCFFVRGKEGPFYVLESMDDPFVSSLTAMTPAVEQILSSAAQPLEKPALDEGGNFTCKTTIFYSNAVFQADMKVQSTGMVEMLDDEPIAADLPVRVSAPIGYLDQR